MLNGLSLFSGIGGIDLALAEWVRTVAYCENDRYAQAVLLSRMQTRELESAPIWTNIRSLTREVLPSLDIIFGGSPCQDISTAGLGAGLDGERSGLIFDVFRLVSECRPRFVFLENVPALAVRGLNRVLLEFHALGYDARWTIVSAAEMGAPHLRERIWILAHATSVRLRDSEQQQEWDSKAKSCNDGKKESLADTDSLRKLKQPERWNIKGDWSGNGCLQMAHSESVGSVEGGQPSGSKAQYSVSDFKSEYCGRQNQWITEPDVGRVAHGVPARVDRLRGLGNAVVPSAAKEAFERLCGLK